MSWRFPVSVTTALQGRLWMGQLIFDGRHQRSVTLSRLRRLSKHRNNHTDQGRKRHVTMALAACEYSHWIRNLFQLLCTTVQLLVA